MAGRIIMPWMLAPVRDQAWRSLLFWIAVLLMSGTAAVRADTMASDAPVTGTVATAAPPAEAWLLTIDGAIGPATADYIVRALAAAGEARAPVVILRMDTPGGLDQAMRDMVRAILDSTTPVACLVAPRGARAASAGTFLMYACHIAAMVPATNLGAASPISIGGARPPDQNEPENKGAVPESTAERKAMNDAAAYIRALAELRGRNADWAEAAVREAATLTAAAAVEAGVIDLVVNSVDDLLQRMDGRTVVVGEKRRTVRLQTAQLGIHTVEPDWRQRFLSVITDPNVAYILMMIGIYGLLLEFYSPGALIPGVAGGICLLLALYAFQVLPVSYTGLALLLLGVALMVAEAAAPSFGVLGLGGVVAFVAGSVLLFDDDIPGLRIALPLVLAVAAVSLTVVMLVIGAALKMRRRRAVGTVQSWVGEPAEAAEAFEREGLVRIHGELWRARSGVPVMKGESVTILAINGLVLSVAPARDVSDAGAHDPSNRNRKGV